MYPNGLTLGADADRVIAEFRQRGRVMREEDI